MSPDGYPPMGMDQLPLAHTLFDRPSPRHPTPVLRRDACTQAQDLALFPQLLLDQSGSIDTSQCIKKVTIFIIHELM